MVSPSILRDAPLIFASDAFRQLLRLAERVAATDRPVLVEGESGTGKARISRFIHESSPRREGPFQIWHAGEANPALALGELFGTVKGAFTGSDRDSEGLVESARGGTLLMDDIDKSPSSIQAQLLRFLDQGTGRRVGSTTYKPLDVRLIFTSNRNLRRLVDRGLFLPDLAYRILGLQVRIPPLRERKDDIRPLVVHMVRTLAGDLTQGVEIRFTSEAMTLLEDDPWSGNVREVAEVVQKILLRAVNAQDICADEVQRVLVERHLETSSGNSEIARLSLLPESERRSRETITLALRLLCGNGRRAAKALGIPERTFRLYLKKYGLTRNRRRDWNMERPVDDPKYPLEACTLVP